MFQLPNFSSLLTRQPVGWMSGAENSSLGMGQATKTDEFLAFEPPPSFSKNYAAIFSENIRKKSIYGSTEAQKPKTFRVATFYAQKLSGRSARNRFSRQA